MGQIPGFRERTHRSSSFTHLMVLTSSFSFPILIPFNSNDASEALNNMHNAELFGRVVRCNYAQPPKIKGGEQGFANHPVWADADQYAADRDEEENEKDENENASDGTEANVD